MLLPAGVDLLILNTAPLELVGRVAVSGQLLFDDDPPARVNWVAQTRKISSTNVRGSGAAIRSSQSAFDVVNETPLRVSYATAT